MIEIYIPTKMKAPDVFLPRTSRLVQAANYRKHAQFRLAYDPALILF